MTTQEQFDNYTSTTEQAMIFQKALAIYEERNAIHRDLWKQYGAKDNELHIRSKFLRAKQLVEALRNGEPVDPQDIIVELLDLVNYAAMEIRNVMADRFDGPPEEDL